MQRLAVPGGLRHDGLDRLEHLHRDVRWRHTHTVTICDDAGAARWHRMPWSERDAFMRHGTVPGALRRVCVEQLDGVHAHVRWRRADAVAHDCDACGARWLRVSFSCGGAAMQRLAMPGGLRAECMECLVCMLAHVWLGQPVARAHCHVGGTARRRGLCTCF